MTSLRSRQGLRFAILAVTLVFASSFAIAAEHDREGESGPWLGVFLEGAEDGPGILIRQVIQDSPAESAGFEDGDIIVEFNGVKIEDERDFYQEFRSLSPDDTVRATVLRGGGEVDLDVTLGEREGGFKFIFPGLKNFDFDAKAFMPQMRQRGYLGVQLQSMTDDLREYFGAPGGEGILIAKVVADSPAERGGLAVGDVILAADGEVIENAGDLVGVLREKQEGDPVDLTIVRDGRTQSLEVTCGVTEHAVWDWSGLAWCDDEDEDCDSNFNFDFKFDENSNWPLGPEFYESMEKVQQYLESPEFEERMEEYYDRSLQYQEQIEEWRERLEEKLHDLEKRLQEFHEQEQEQEEESSLNT
jgi:predicted metalloprotease with PDZ domain